MSEPTPDALWHQLMEQMRRTPSYDPASRERLTALIRSGSLPQETPNTPSLIERVWRWLVAPRPVPVSPLGAAAVLAVLLVGGWSFRSTPSPVPATGMVGEAVQFVLKAPLASHVSVVGEFNNWDPEANPMQQTAEDGVWSILVPLASGRHTYAFVVDGDLWLADERAPKAPEDEFGRANSVVMVRNGG